MTDKMTTDERVVELEVLYAGTTPGEWCADKGSVRTSAGGPEVFRTGRPVVWGGMSGYQPAEAVHDAAFAAAAHRHLPALLSALRDERQAQSQLLANLSDIAEMLGRPGCRNVMHGPIGVGEQTRYVVEAVQITRDGYRDLQEARDDPDAIRQFAASEEHHEEHHRREEQLEAELESERQARERAEGEAFQRGRCDALRHIAESLGIPGRTFHAVNKELARLRELEATAGEAIDDLCDGTTAQGERLIDFVCGCSPDAPDQTGAVCGVHQLTAALTAPATPDAADTQEEAELRRQEDQEDAASY